MNTNNTSATQETRNESLMKIARRRVSFKKHAAVYLIVNTAITALCLIDRDTVPVGLWLSWGLGLAIQGFFAYIGFDEDRMIEREYAKLK